MYLSPGKTYVRVRTENAHGPKIWKPSVSVTLTSTSGHASLKRVCQLKSKLLVSLTKPLTQMYSGALGEGGNHGCKVRSNEAVVAVVVVVVVVVVFIP